MKKTLVATALIIAIGSSLAIAAPNGGKRMATLINTLGLNEAQTTQVKDILKEQRKQIRAIRQATDQKIQSVLTPEQFTKYQALSPRKNKPRQQTNTPPQ